MVILRQSHLKRENGHLDSRSDRVFFPSLQNKLQQYISLIFLSSALGWVMIVHMSIPVLPYDDAFVTFRYVQNFLAGKGLVYNQGQRVFGSTTPLYFIWLTILKVFFSGWAIPHLAVRFNAIPFGSAGIVLFFLLRKYTGNISVALLGSLTFLLNPMLLSISGGGMESFLFVTLLLLALLGMADNKPIWTGLLSGLSVLTRPEGLLILPIVLLQFRNRPRELMQTLLSFSLVLLPWVSFSWLYFGTPIPLSLIAKAKPLYPLPKGQALEIINGWMTAWVSGFFSEDLRILITITAWGLLILTSLGIIYNSRHADRAGWQGITLFWLFILSYGIGNPSFFSWYWPNVFVFALVTLLAGFYFWGHFLVDFSKGIGRLVWLIGVCLLIYTTLMPNLRPIIKNRAGISAATWFIISDSSRWRILAYEQAAQILNQEALPTDTVATPEVGALGFYFKGFIYDACGLVSPEALPYLPVPPDQRLGPHVGAISTEFTKKVKPAWVVTMPYFSIKSLLQSDWFERQYYLYKKLPLPFPVWGDSVVHIYKKRNKPTIFVGIF